MQFKSSKIKAEVKSFFLPLALSGLLLLYNWLYVLLNQEPGMPTNDSMIAMVMPWSAESAWAQVVLLWLALLFQNPKVNHTRMILDGMSGVEAVMRWQHNTLKSAAAYTWLLPILSVLTPLFYQENWPAFSTHVLVLALTRWLQFIVIGWVLSTCYYLLSQVLDRYLVWVILFLVYIVDSYLYTLYNVSPIVWQQEFSKLSVTHHLHNLPYKHDITSWLALLAGVGFSTLGLAKLYSIRNFILALGTLRVSVWPILALFIFISYGPSYDLVLVSGIPNEKTEGHVLINFWATWCRPCMLELEELGEQAKTYPAKRLILVNNQPDSISRVKLQERGIVNQTNIQISTHAALGGTLNQYFRLITGSNEAVYPTTLLVKNGLIQEVHTGYIPSSTLAYDSWFKRTP